MIAENMSHSLLVVIDSIQCSLFGILNLVDEDCGSTLCSSPVPGDVRAVGLCVLQGNLKTTSRHVRINHEIEGPIPRAVGAIRQIKPGNEKGYK